MSLFELDDEVGTIHRVAVLLGKVIKELKLTPKEEERVLKVLKGEITPVYFPGFLAIYEENKK